MRRREKGLVLFGETGYNKTIHNLEGRSDSHERTGFIHDKLDIKFLILYLMARVASPVDFATLADLTFCDDGVEYFDFAASVAELVETGHLQLEGERYTITEKGRRNGKICESSLAFSVRRKCDRNLARVNGVLRRDAQVRAEILPREDSGSPCG